MSSDSLKLEKHLCRCCHAEGCFKTLGVSFDAESSGVVYSDMIRDYLDINLTPVAGPLCLVTYTICEECVSRLHDCVSFKKQVLACEERFRDMYRRDLIKVQNPDLAANIKLEIDIQDIPSTYVEALKVECPKQDVEDFAQESDFDYQDDIDLDELPNQDDSTKINLEMSEDNLTKVEDLKKKEKGKGKAKATKTTKKVAKPKKSALSEPGEKKAKKGRNVPKIYHELFTVDEQDNYVCKKCHSKYRNVHHLTEHLRDHLKHLFQCPLCHKMYKGQQVKTDHLILEHGKEEYFDNTTNSLQVRDARKHICDICQREYALKKDIRNHIRAVHKEVKCILCSEIVLKKKLHIHNSEVHGTVLPTCGLCGYTNACESAIVTHQRSTHLKEKNCTCPECDMQFFSQKHLRRHMIVHNPVKEFECPHCQKKFPRKNTLRMHVRIHTGEKNKVCKVCGDRFVQKASLNYHMARHHPEAY